MNSAVLEKLEANDTYYSKMLYDETIKNFVKASIEKYGTEEKLGIAEKVIDQMIQKFRKDHQININSEHGWIQPMIAAGYIHNLFYTSSAPVTSLVAARENLHDIAEQHLPENIREYVFQAVEAQLGADTPIPALTPHGEHPMKVFADSCWEVEERKGNKKMPWAKE